MKKVFLTGLASVALLLGLTFTTLAPAVFAADPPTAQQTVCEGSDGVWNASEKTCKTKSTNGSELTATIKNVVNLLLFLIGVTAVIFIIIAAFRFVTANGDSNSVTSARNTILYAVVGLVVAISAYAIVNFVVGQL